MPTEEVPGVQHQKPKVRSLSGCLSKKVLSSSTTNTDSLGMHRMWLSKQAGVMGFETGEVIREKWEVLSMGACIWAERRALQERQGALRCVLEVHSTRSGACPSSLCAAKIFLTSSFLGALTMLTMQLGLIINNRVRQSDNVLRAIGCCQVLTELLMCGQPCQCMSLCKHPPEDLGYLTIT
eukprot:519424-Pelagomonas_calceolata.AAC.3